MSRIIFVEASIGAGKSTLLANLAAAGESVFSEPVEAWTETLRLAYADPVKWRPQLQLLALTTRLEVVVRATLAARSAPKGRVFVERSMRSTGIFDAMAEPDESYRAAHARASSLERDLMAGMSVEHVYIRCPPSVCAERIAMRARRGEDLVGDALLRDLHDAHEAEFADDPVVDGRQTADGVLRDVMRRCCECPSPH
jgi:deoxyadenosine/deoxycytidine kinase